MSVPHSKCIILGCKIDIRPIPNPVSSCNFPERISLLDGMLTHGFSPNFSEAVVIILFAAILTGLCNQYSRP